MKTITLDSTSKITRIFELLEISDPSLIEMHHTLLSIDERKEEAVIKTNYEKAVRLRRKGSDMIRKICESLNSKGILNEDILQIKFIESPGEKGVDIKYAKMHSIIRKKDGWPRSRS